MKLKEIARITGADSSFTSIKYKTVKELGPKASAKDLSLATVYEYDEPLSIAEITAHINNTLGTSFSDPHIRYSLEELLKSGDVLMRVETPEERRLRGNGVEPTMNKLAKMFFKRGVGVPHRKTVELVPGVVLKGPSSPREKYKPRLGNPTPTPAVSQNLKSSALDNSALDFLIEKLVAERTADLQKKLDEANAKLEQFKKLLN